MRSLLKFTVDKEPTKVSKPINFYGQSIYIKLLIKAVTITRLSERKYSLIRLLLCCGFFSLLMLSTLDDEQFQAVFHL